MASLATFRSWIRGSPGYDRLRGNEDPENELGSVIQESPSHSSGLIDPPGYGFSPLQQWLTPLMKSTQEKDSFSVEDLPSLSKDARFLYPLHKPLLHHNLRAFLLQHEIAGKLLIGSVLELTSCLCGLSAPLVLRKILQEPTATGVLLLFCMNLLGTLLGRSKDQVCRVQSTMIASMLKLGLFHRSLRLSAKGQVEFPAGTIINISTHDVAFMRNYFLKVHDIWSAILQITVIFFIVFWIMGYSCLIAFFTMFLLFASQSQANFLAKESSLNCDTANDERLNYLRNFLYNVKAIKVRSLESLFRRKIFQYRNEQLEWLGTWLRLTFCFFTSVNQMIPAITAVIAFVAYWWTGHELTSDVVFPLLALFDMIYQPAAKLSISVTRQFSVIPCFKRIMSLLTAEEHARNSLMEPENEKDAITFDNAHISYPQLEHSLPGTVQESLKENFALGPLRFSIPKNRLTIVVGPTGSGKSTLIRAITGQIPVSTPQSMRMKGTVALSEQDPWIRSATARENIVFTSDWNEERYRKTVRDCCLEEDFTRWPAGDQTIMGEKGSNISGGQRARISLARAVYSEADIILLDDPLAAVDAFVGNKLFYECIRKLQQTVILVTHQTQFLHAADNVINLRQGEVVNATISTLESPRGSGLNPSTSDSMVLPSSNNESSDGKQMLLRDQGTAKTIEGLHEEEERATGRVKGDVYRLYLHSAGGTRFITILCSLFLVSLAVRVIANYWFVWWLDDSFNLTSGMYLLGYVILTLFQACSLASIGMFSVSGSLHASHKIHTSIMENLFHAPLSYYETQPVGRIINRLSSDLDAIDSNLMNAVDGLFNAGSQIAASTVMIVVATPLMLVILLPLSLVAYRIQALFRVSARELRRIGTILDSPVITILSETLGAVSTIRAYGQQAEEYFLHIYEEHLNRATSASITKDSLDTWVTTRAELLSALIVLSCGILYVMDILPPFQAGLAISTAITFTKSVYLLLWSMIQVEVEMNSVERLQHYTSHIPQEIDGDHQTLSSAWPENGHVEFSNVISKYRSQKELALDNINLNIKPGERVGLVGRTGSGKTTLVSSLSRLQEIISGTIKIDGVDIQQVPLFRLRHSVYALPQEPLLFKGTLRENLDPRGDLRNDAALWNALSLCGLDESFRTGLETPIEFKGSNLSAGQTQLLCMARAILQSPKVLIIDEATASVDAMSDGMIQHALQTQFPQTTILSVAHRISTLVWMDRIVVMDGGKIVEEGSPRELLGRGQGQGQGGKEGEEESLFRRLMRVDGDEVFEKTLAKLVNGK